MKMCVVVSDGVIPKERGPFAVTFDNTYAERFLKHLKNDPTLCTGCGERCRKCRNRYKIDFTSDISELIKVPSALPYYVDQPEKHLSKNLKPHDALVAINIHEEMLMALPEMAKKAGCKAILVPQEDPDWLTKWVIAEMTKNCKELGLEVSFPKPFCALEEDESHPFINQFMDYFKMGKPKLRLAIKDGRIDEAEVLRSAPCGDTYYVAYNIRGKKVDEKLDFWASKYWHSYPCVASMKMDYEIGDTILHKGGYILLDAVHQALETKPLTSASI